MFYRHFTAFLAVAEDLHFSRAAQRLHIAQPALSQQIRQLERELGVQLFERDSRSVRLTSAGQAMVGPARAAIESLEEARQAAQAGGKGELGRVSIGFSGASSHGTLPRLTLRVRQDHPGIALKLNGNLAANAALNLVADGTLDLGFVRMPVNRVGVSTRIIGREELLVAIPKDHPLSQSSRIDMKQLVDQPFVIPPAGVGSSLRDAILHECMVADFTPKIAQEAEDSYTILALVAAGVGVTLTLSSICEHIRNESIVFRPLSGKPRYLYPALAWREIDHSPALHAVLAAAQQEFGEVDMGQI